MNHIRSAPDPARLAPLATPGLLTRRVLAVCAVMLAALTAALVGGLLPPAAAHTQLTGTTPTPGASLPAAPGQATFTFSDRLVPQYNTAALRVDDGPEQILTSRINDTTLIVEIPVPPPGGGSWRLSYRVVAQDGHPITGDLTFVVDPDRDASAAATTRPPPGSAGPASPATTTPAPTEPPNYGRLFLLVAVLGFGAVLLAAATLASRQGPASSAEQPARTPAPDQTSTSDQVSEEASTSGQETTPEHANGAAETPPDDARGNDADL